MSRRRLLTMVVAPTLVIGLVIGTLMLVDAANRREQVRVADAAAAEYTEALQAFRKEVAAGVETADFEDAVAVGDFVAQAAQDLPELAAVDGHGARASDAYRFAESVRAQMRESLDDLQEKVEGARRAQSFVAAAEQALAVDPRSFLSSTTLSDGGPVRAQVLPPLRNALAGVEDLDVPEGADEAHQEVADAIRFVIGEAETLAAELDAGRGYQFEFGIRYGEARSELARYSATSEASLREAFDRVVGEPAATA
ncbi:hypothetical protein [Aeromicrobium sp. CTD01-1L150]|uniref:hypothetical protein n=1 Tax=Aeromicrobium sp. CTD01-1L150 TaxID=3341830 RepID=UPI0035C05F46